MTVTIPCSTAFWSTLLAIFILSGFPAPGAEPTSTPPSSKTQTQLHAPATPQSESESTPVAIPPPSEKALRHYHTGMVWFAVRTLWEIALPAAIVFTGLSVRLRDFSLRLGRKRFFAFALYIILLALFAFALTWPLDYFQDFVRPHAYGLSNQTFAKWQGDSLKELAVTLPLGILLLSAGYWLLRKCPRRWWLYAALAMVPFYFFIQMIRPTVFDPLFNDFTPLQDKALETKILALADRSGIHGSRVYQVNKSVDTRTVNAYVTGFLGTKRIVLWDTALDKLDEHELLFVTGHEMGHYVLGHVTRGVLALCALTFVAFFLVDRIAAQLIRRLPERLGFAELSDMASLPLIVALMNALFLVLAPVGFAYSRHLEHEADRFGLEITHYNHSAATGFVRLQDENLGIPRPGLLFTILRATHPSIGDRIDFFNTYKPWEQGLPCKYESHFAPSSQTTASH